MESLTLTWTIVRPFGPLLRRYAWMSPGSSTKRSTVRFSIGAGGSRSRRRIVARTSPISTTSSRIGPIRALSAVFNLEQSDPAQFGKLGLVRVEQVSAGELVAELEDAPLALHQSDRIRVRGWFQPRAGRVVIEKVSVQ